MLSYQKFQQFSNFNTFLVFQVMTEDGPDTSDTSAMDSYLSDHRGWISPEVGCFAKPWKARKPDGVLALHVMVLSLS